VLADMLFVASDHVPVICEYRLPGRLSASLPASFGRVIQNSTQSISLTLQNTAPAVVAAGAETIQFSATAGGALTGAASGTLAPLAAPTLRSFTINTTVFGNVIGSVQTTSTSQGAGGPVNAVTSGTIVRAANPSFSGSSDVDNLTFEWVVNDDSGTAVLAIPIHNLGYDTFQALLDVDAVSFVTAPLSISGALPVNIGASSGNITLHYDTNAATPGDHEHALAVMVSDENIPGATTRFVFLTLDVHVQSEAIPGDVDGDGDVDFSDLLALLSAWGTCPPDPQPCPADFDNSGAVDFGDLLILLAGWSV